MSMDFQTLRDQIPALKHTIYMNTGSSGPSPQPVVEAETAWTRYLSEAGPTTPPVAEAAREVGEGLRSRLAAWMNASPDEVALTHNASEGIGIVAAGLPWQSGDEIITSGLEHGSGILPWLHLQERRGVQVVHLPVQGSTLAAEAVAQAVTDRTRLVCMSHVAYNTGARAPIAQVATHVRERGVRLLVDGAQAAGQIPLDMQALGCDFYALPGQKWLLGPEGTGAFFIRKELLEEVETLRVAWASVDTDDLARLTYRLHPSARRYEVATMHVPSLAGLNAAIQIWQKIGMSEVEGRISGLVRHLRAGLQEVPGLELLTPAGTGGAGLQSFIIRGMDPDAAVQQLYERHRIVCRSIPHPSCLRLSVHGFNTEAEIDQVVEAIGSLTG